MQESQYKDHFSSSVQEPASMPVCCGTGCTVCVLDYPEQFLDPRSQDSELMAMLAAFEEAEAAVAKPDSET